MAEQPTLSDRGGRRAVPARLSSYGPRRVTLDHPRRRPCEPEHVFNDAPADIPSDQRYTAVFDDYVTDEKDKHLLDHLLLSPSFTAPHLVPPLTKKAGSGRIGHDAWVHHVSDTGAKRDQRPTDHRPVLVTLELP